MPVTERQEEEHACCRRLGLSVRLTKEEHGEQDCNLGFSVGFERPIEMQEQHAC